VVIVSAERMSDSMRLTEAEGELGVVGTCQYLSLFAQV
jgi:hypothetical protein